MSLLASYGMDFKRLRVKSKSIGSCPEALFRIFARKHTSQKCELIKFAPPELQLHFKRPPLHSRVGSLGRRSARDGTLGRQVL